MSLVSVAFTARKIPYQSHPLYAAPFVTLPVILSRTVSLVAALVDLNVCLCSFYLF